MQLSKLGEFGLIELIKNKQKFRRKDTVLGIGDDAAALRMTNDQCQMSNKSSKPCLPAGRSKSKKLLLITTDAMVEGVHFKLKGLSFVDLGCKTMLSNISDIAAMGGIPTHALITLGAPKRFSIESILQFQKGLNRIARKHDIDIIGGDTVASPKAFFISITLLGEVEKECLLLRSGARSGELIMVTGSFGNPAALKFDSRKVRVVSRLKEARIIARSQLATSMIDSSDGLARSVSEICKASRTGALLFANQIPAAKGATLDQALYGGEEYELVFTASAKDSVRIRKMVKCCVVGQICGKKSGITIVHPNGKVKALKHGFDHFSK